MSPRRRTRKYKTTTNGKKIAKQYRRKKTHDQLQEHLALASRARRFEDKKKKNDKFACRGKINPADHH